MKVLLLTHSYDPEVTAPQRRWNAFVSVFRARGWDVDVVVPVAHPERTPAQVTASEYGRALRRESGRHGERILRVPLVRHTESRLSKLVSNVASSVLAVPRALLAGRADVVVVTVPALPNIAAGYAVSRLWRRPLIVDMRDAWPDLARDAEVVTSDKPGVMETVVAFVQRRAEAVVSVTSGFAELLRERGARRVEVVPNGVLKNRMPPLVEPSSATPERPLRVLYLGNHGESQGLEVLIDAARACGTDVHLRLVGTGTRKRALLEHAGATGAVVEFLDATHDAQTLAQYDWADTTVVSLRDDWPSFDWTIPSKTYELLAVGKHITAVVRGEAAEILAEAGGADVVPADPDAIAALWRDLHARPERLRVGDAGRQWVARHRNLGPLGEDFADLVQEIAGDSSAPGRRRAKTRNNG
ncbi:glycosyltransferase family 4 protein [Zhihengliuella halotolerans]|uniref:D-inositol 3-phosphate glycosyltransferase n=1 Tax=Zhihengliuella halotolerans TaxID=370736 RepID=A0A4Q8AD52_9MICC|nr:glycosyltransferase family 4 protein [Zhihengliuella halotolerans]RZU61553.1 glycosyltransferase involved in cell wall biosynthesis [Zhihengliuella halotolerans]